MLLRLDDERRTLARVYALAEKGLLIGRLHVVAGHDLDHALAELGHQRRFPLLLSGFANTPFVLATTDYATTMPLGAARLFAQHFPLRIVELPIALPDMRFSMLWHRRHQTAPAHIWLRQQMRRALRP